MKNHIANVLDLELSCYPGGIFPADERQEIIEIGLTTVDLARMKVLKVRSIPIIPTMSSISPFCTELTGWTEEALKRQVVNSPKLCAASLKSTAVAIACWCLIRPETAKPSIGNAHSSA